MLEAVAINWLWQIKTVQDASVNNRLCQGAGGSQLVYFLFLFSDILYLTCIFVQIIDNLQLCSKCVHTYNSRLCRRISSLFWGILLEQLQLIYITTFMGVSRGILGLSHFHQKGDIITNNFGVKRLLSYNIKLWQKLVE
jgi:hypothetical protein